jgi:hypothetical protein
MSALRLHRRDLLIALGALALGGALAPSPEPAAAEVGGRGLAGRLRDPEAARRLGLAYLSRHPGERDFDLLHAATLKGAGEGARAVRRLRARCREDFARGDTVRIDGWVLARTECRLCALVALS